MIEVLKIDMKTTKTRLGVVYIKYYNLVVCCDICIYKNENLWLRMPEIWLTPTIKRSFVFWESKQDSKDFQKDVLNKLFDMVGLTLESAMQMRAAFFAKRKEMTNNRKEITFDKKKL